MHSFLLATYKAKSARPLHSDGSNRMADYTAKVAKRLLKLMGSKAWMCGNCHAGVQLGKAERMP